MVQASSLRFYGRLSGSLLHKANDMIHPFPILAARDDGWGKAIPILIVVAIWVIGGVASSIGKAAKQRAATNAPPPIPPPVPPPAGSKRGEKKKSKKQPGGPPPLPVASKKQFIPPENIELPPAAVSHAGGAAITAATVRGWLRPDVLRSQYLAAELFDPPGTLNDSGGSGGSPARSRPPA